MVIAHVLSSFCIGGQEVMAAELASRQVARGQRVLAISLAQTTGDPLEATFARAGVKALRVPRLGPRFDPSLPIRLALVLRRESVDVLHLHNPLPLLYGAMAAKLARCRVVATRHGLVEMQGRQLWLRRQAVRLIDGYVAVSAEVASNARAHHVASEPKLSIIDNGIDLSRYQPRPEWRRQVRAELGLPDGARVLGTVCRLAHYKNVGLLLRSALPHLGPDTQVIVVGEGPDRGALEALAAGHPNGRFIHLLGQRFDVDRLLSAMDMFVLSSTTEGHPIAVIEAMATCLPVLATKVGGLPEMIEDGETGYLTTLDEASFAARLEAALRESERWPAMGIAARKVALERFSSDRMAERYQALYEKVLRGE